MDEQFQCVQLLPFSNVITPFHSISRLVKCALDQTPKQLELAQSSMASFLADNPKCLLLWRM